MEFTRSRLIGLGVGVLAVLIVAANTLFIVDQTTQVLVLRFGEPVGTINSPRHPDPGLKVKAPFLENVVRFDKRNLALEPDPEEITARNQARLMVDSFVRYRISNPLQYYRAFGTDVTAKDRIERLVNSVLLESLGRATDQEIISTRRAGLMREVHREVARRAVASNWGIEVLDVRIRRADLPDANRDAVFTRMQSERQQEATQKRAFGKQRAVAIEAEARKNAETIRGEADSARARIFADSFGRDPSFARFYRSMQAYEVSLGQGDTTLVLSPDSEFFRYFSTGPGR